MPLSIDLFPGGATRVSTVEVGHFIQRHVQVLLRTLTVFNTKTFIS